jgi:hypothetical protein
MLGASKILTVSYGTFSCTLEGFDGPFNTMKAIAEYFRDLAAEDRYFGAEPPTPDAAMLHKIAEREIQRRVEAKIQDNGVILRADAQDGTPPNLTPLAAAVRPSLSETSVLGDSGESIGARLSRLRAAPVLPESKPQPGATDLPVVEDAGDVAGIAAEASARLASVAGLSGTGLLDDVYTEDQHAGDMELDMLASVEALAALPAETEALGLSSVTTTPDLAPEAVPGDTATSTEAFLAELDFQASATELADPNLDLVDLDIVAAEALADIAPPPIAADPIAADPIAADPADLDQTDPETEALLAALASQTAPEPILAAEVATETDAKAQAAKPPAQIPAERPQTAEEALAEALGIDAPEARAMIEQSAPEADAPSVPQENARVRVMRVRRSDPTPEVTPPSFALSKEAEASLAAELAALQNEPPAALPPSAQTVRPTRPVRPARPDPTSIAAEPATVAEPAEPADLHQGLSDLSKEESVNRLIAQTNTALEGPELRRRSAALSHLKAAVVATEADRQLQDSAFDLPTDPKSAYRNDLDSVVRTHPSSDRPSPLVLVSEQRIDRPKLADQAAVTPPARAPMPTRLVPAVLAGKLPEALIGGDLDDDEDDAALTAEEARANLFTDPASFAEFAEQLGAESLHDLLEASAVYCAQVLGRAQFSRPLVMSQIESLPEANKHRLEDQLRAFGTLMREGRITKVKRGGFAITDRSPLLAEALRNAG